MEASKKMNEANPATHQRQKKKPGPAPLVWTLGRVRSRCDIDGDCWLWTGKLVHDRYPAASIGGSSKSVPRWVLEQVLGRPVKPGMNCELRCQNARCVSPECVEEVSTSKMLKAALARAGVRLKRTASTRELNRANAIANGWAKLTQEQARRIRDAKGVRTSADLAAEHGVSEATVASIWAGRRWREPGATVFAPNSSVFSWRPAA